MLGLCLNLENFCCYGIVDLGLVILISGRFGRFVLDLINFSVSIGSPYLRSALALWLWYHRLGVLGLLFIDFSLFIW